MASDGKMRAERKRTIRYEPKRGSLPGTVIARNYTMRDGVKKERKCGVGKK